MSNRYVELADRKTTEFMVKFANDFPALATQASVMKAVELSFISGYRQGLAAGAAGLGERQTVMEAHNG